MSGLREPGLGPIVGHTTSTSCRLWIRAEDPADVNVDLDEDRRTVGVMAPLEENGIPLNHPPAYFRLHREYDRTRTFNLGVDTGIATTGSPNTLFKMKPDTEYVVGLGTLTIDDPSDTENTVILRLWH